MRLSRLLCIAALCMIATPAFAQTGGDDCTLADPVIEGAFDFDTTLATLAGPTDCDPNMGPDMWYLYTASATATARIDTCATIGTLTDTTLIVYDATTGCPVPGDLGLACDDDTCAPAAGGAAFSSVVEIPVMAGGTYYVQVGGWNAGTGTGTLTIALVETNCFDTIDDDGDGLTDCADPDCATVCDESLNCADGIDNDSDGDIDCVDIDCVASTDCIEAGNCGDGIDNDLDGDIDCIDLDCVADAICLEAGNCADGIDNDLDGDVDCVDADCAADIACLPPALNDECVNAQPVAEGTFAWDNTVTPVTGPVDCDGNMTNDVWFLYTATATADAVIDTCGALGTMTDTTLIVYDATPGCPVPGDLGLACDDDTCASSGSASNFMSQVTIPVVAGQSYYIQVGGWNGSTGNSEINISLLEGDCFDGIDGDGDGLTDCADDDCLIDCDESLNCLDGIDNDSDGDTDCVDVDCAASTDCIEAGNCADGIDNDLDGAIDCVDADCLGDIACDESQNCADGIDNDLDGDIDCVDADCAAALACLPIAPNDECTGATPVTEGVWPWDNGVNFQAPVDGPIDCDGNMTGDVWFLYTATVTGDAIIGGCGAAGSIADTTLIVYDATAGCPLAGDLGLACDDDTCANGSGGANFMSQVTIPVIAGNSYYVQIGGWNGTTGDSELFIEIQEDCTNGIDDNGDGLVDCADATCNGDPLCVIEPATAVVCSDSGVSIDATWAASVGGPGQDSQNVYVDGVLVLAGEPLTTTSFSSPYAAGFSGTVEICVETVFGANTSALACCTLFVGGEPNDECTGAIVAVTGDNPWDNTLTSDSTPDDCDTNMSTDLWYSYTVPSDGNLLISTCNSAGIQDTTLIVYDGTLGCPLPGDLGLACDDDTCANTGGANFLSEVTIPVVAGQELLIQVGGWNGSTGAGVLTIGADCGDLVAANCAYDSVAGSVTVDWTDNVNAASYEIFENGVSVGTAPAGSSSFVVASPAAGFNTYEVTWTCSLTSLPGISASCTANVVLPIPPGTTDVIIANEGIGTLDVGQIASVPALQAALAGQAGLSVHTVSGVDFDTLGLDFTGVERVWVMLGSFPDDYRLTAAEGDLLATLNTNDVGLYIESGDHWGFQPVPSLLDARDGVDAVGIIDGDDSFTAMDAVTGNVEADLAATFATPTIYNQDQAGTDWNDQLVVAAADAEVVVAEAVWTNNDDTATGEVPYITGIFTTHTTGANMLIQSWEFGGFGGDQNLLVGEYLGLLGGGGTGDPQFVRGDANADGTRNIADAISILGVLFPQGAPPTPPCESALDANDDGGLNIADAIALLGVLFPNQSPPPMTPAPAPNCGVDPTPDTLTCNSFPPCP